MGPEKGTEEWREQVNRISTFLRATITKDELKRVSMMYILDQEYSRGAITQAMHDVEIEKGWH